ncbi:MAG: cyanophycin synthetase family protein, partial [Planctomycetota bacterium]
MSSDSFVAPLTFRKVLALRGPNTWANFPVLEVWVDLAGLKDTSSEMIPGFNDRLKGWLPTLIEHRCSVGERGGFFERLRRGTYMAHILEHVVLELQSLAGTEVGYGRARELDEEGVYRVAIEYQEESLARAALEVGRRLVLAAVEDQPFDVAGEVAKLRELAYDVCLGPSTRSIVDAARKRGIPFFRLNSGSLVQLGYGSRQRRILTAETDRTPAIAESIAQDKELTRR